MLRYENLSRSAGNKKWVSVAAVADYGNAQALWVPQAGGPFSYGIGVGAASLLNRSGGAAAVGLGGRFDIATWAAGTVTSAGAYTDATSAAQNATTGDFTLHDKTDSGSGFLISADLPFNIIGLVQSAAGDQVGPTQIVEYWNGAAWTAITSALLINDALDANGTGEKVLCFPQPSDWAVGGTGTGVPSTRYNLRVRQTIGGAGTANPVASQVFIGRAKMELSSLGNNAIASLIREHEYLFPPQCQALFPIFSTASYANTVEVDVRAY